MNDDPPDPLNETPTFDSRFAVSDEDVRGFCERAMAERRAGEKGEPSWSEYDSDFDSYQTDPERSGLQFPDDPEGA